MMLVKEIANKSSRNNSRQFLIYKEVLNYEAGKFYLRSILSFKINKQTNQKNPDQDLNIKTESQIFFRTYQSKTFHKIII